MLTVLAAFISFDRVLRILDIRFMRVVEVFFDEDVVSVIALGLPVDTFSSRMFDNSMTLRGAG